MNTFPEVNQSLYDLQNLDFTLRILTLIYIYSRYSSLYNSFGMNKRNLLMVNSFFSLQSFLYSHDLNVSSAVVSSGQIRCI